MSITIDVHFDVASATEGLKAIAKQVPFAMALAATRTAGKVQDALREDLPRHFIVRSTWVSKGIRIVKATKRTLTAEVGSKDPFMERQESGGTKTGRGGGMVAVPAGIRKTPEQRTTKGKWPGAMLQKKNVFIHELDSGNLGIFRHYAAGRMKLLYVLVPSITVKPRWNFFDLAWATVRRVWEHEQIKAMLEALRTAR